MTPGGVGIDGDPVCRRSPHPQSLPIKGREALGEAPAFIVSLPLVGRDQGWEWATRTRPTNTPHPGPPHKGEGEGRAMSTALSINAIDLHYGAAQALKSVSIECRPGRITLLAYVACPASATRQKT